MIIRPMRSEELAFAAECPALEGWTSETLEVFEGFHRYDPEGCLIAEEAGALLGVCMATAYGGFGFIGELVVRKAGRGRGVGPRLLESGVNYLRTRGIENICLDGVAKAAPFYELSGFRTVCDSLRFAGRPEEIPQAGGPDSGRLRPMRPEDLPSVLVLDREAFGADRGFFLRRRLSLHPELSWVAEDHAGIAGFILGYPGDGITAVGPWVAAVRLPRPVEMLIPFRAAARYPCLRIGVLETNAAAVRALRALPGLTEQPPSRRMVLGPSDRLGNSPMCWAVGSAAKG